MPLTAVPFIDPSVSGVRGIHWKAYAAVATAQYRPQLLTRIGYLDLKALTPSAAADVEIAKAWIKVSHP